jgi:hypothetical protein
MSSPGAAGVEKTVELISQFQAAPVRIERRDTSIKITPTEDGGFPIMVYDEGDETMIAAERWHTHYDDPLQVAFCVIWLMTPFYRVVHETKGGSLVAAWIERYEETGWEGFEPAYFLNPEHEESWELAPGEHYQRRYMQQAILPPPQPYNELCPGAQLNEDGLPPNWQHGSWVVTAEEAIGPSLLDDVIT